MSTLTKRLEHLNALPSKSSGEFDSWLAQHDAISFIKQSTTESEFLVYASLPRFYLYAVLAPLAKLDPLNTDDLLRWSCNPSDSWGIWSTRDSIGLSQPLDNTGCETLKDGEQLIFIRSFDDYIGEKH